MAGLNLGVNGGVRASTSYGTGSPTSATQAAYGAGYTDSGSPNTLAAVTPNDPFGTAFWAGIAGFGILFLIRRSLPR